MATGGSSTRGSSPVARRRSIHYELRLLREQRELKRTFEALSLSLHSPVRIHHQKSNTLAAGELEAVTLTVNGYGEPRLSYWLRAGGAPITGTIALRDAVDLFQDGGWTTLQAGAGANYRDRGDAELFLGEDPAGGKIRLLVFRIGASTSFEELKDFAQDGYDSPITLKPFKEGMRVGTDYEDRKVLASLSFDSFSHDHQFVTPGAALLWREYEDGLKALHFAADADELQLYLDELQGLEISDGEDEEDD